MFLKEKLIQKLQTHTNDNIKKIGSLLKNNNKDLFKFEIENNLTNRILITKLQGVFGNTIGENFNPPKTLGILFMYTTKPCSPLSMINLDENLYKSMIQPEYNDPKLIELLKIRSKAIQSFLQSGGYFINIYEEDHHNQQIMDNINQFKKNHPINCIIVKSKEKIQFNAGFYIINHKENSLVRNRLSLIKVLSSQISSANQIDKTSIEIETDIIDINQNHLFKQINNIFTSNDLSIHNLLSIENQYFIQNTIHNNKQLVD